MRSLSALVKGSIAWARDQARAVTGAPERELVLGGVLVFTGISAVIGFVLTQYLGIDVLSSVVSTPYDCWIHTDVHVGRHCFSDYSMAMGQALRPDPWAPYPVVNFNTRNWVGNPYSAAALVPHAFFGEVGRAWGSSMAGLAAYELVLTAALLAPAVWAARGARGLEKVVVFLALGVMAVPMWIVIDRANSMGFAVPVFLAFLVALCRQRWGLVVVLVVLASLIKPQFLLLGLVLPAARQWKMSASAAVLGIIVNLGAYLLWPRHFPATVLESIRGSMSYGASFEALVGGFNVSFQKGVFTISDALAAMAHGGRVPDGFLAHPRIVVGWVVLATVAAAVLALGRRIPPVMAGIILIATASLFPPVTFRYYLAFALPVAALMVRSPNASPGIGLFGRLAELGDRRRAVGVCVSIACVLTFVILPVPGHSTREPIRGLPIGELGVPQVLTTASVIPVSWLVAITVILVSYARRPAAVASTVSA